MTLSTADDLDRATSGRFVRNLALSLSGGALVTLLGATAAQAQDGGSAGTASDGTGAAHSGDATAVGNQSGTTQTQTVTVSGNLGVIQVINQQAAVSNTGAAVANTGGNIAIGNASNNTADATQTGNSGLGPASNSGQAANGSNGTATISTGNASAVGNQSNTSINQTAHGSAHGQLGGILVINQDAIVTNSGVALANSGGNFAMGNDSDNTAGLLQGANSAAGIAANDGKAASRSDGLATINTGNASATGNRSNTQITQSATGSAGGALGGLVIIDQDAFVLNTGAAVANSGGNAAIGNTSLNGANVDQTIGEAGPPVAGPIGVASNNGEASNWSDGTAGIATGDATAYGNDPRTKITQNADADITGPGGGSLVSQSSGVVNAGFALANSGGNFALGNDSDNDAFTDQVVPSSGGSDVGVVGNFGLAENQSDGTGLVHSGSASAAGNRSATEVQQNVKANGGAFNLQTQANLVTNTGLGLSNSGLNAGVGNLSDNGAGVEQDATLSDDPGLDVGVVGQFGKASNSSDGTGSVTTGNASAVGNSSDTAIAQTIDPSGVVINTQAAAVVNAGVGIANSGGNVAVGNNSTNGAGAVQGAEIGNDNAVPPFILAGTIVASNNGEASNTSDGTATIKTGDAYGVGNSSGTTILQEANGAIDGGGVILNTQLGGVVNAGLGIANSGGNFALGNTSDNTTALEQDADVLSDLPGGATPTLVAGIVTASNDGTASNTSDGSASITTGNAAGTGNRSQTHLAQKAEGDIDGLGLVLNTQVGGVLNTGVGIGNSGLNAAVGNASDNDADLDQDAEIASDNGDDTTLIAGFVTAANSGTSENVSDGSADIRTGAAEGFGNVSATNLTQDADGHVNGLGLVVNTQVGGVANVGLGVANSGVNGALGNFSDQDELGGAELEQDAEILSNNDDTADGFVFGPVTAANNGTASNTSDGEARIRTGGAQGQGNVSSTNFGQASDGTVNGLGADINTQVGGVLNAGVGIANSGVNGALGNASNSDTDFAQDADIASDNTAATDLNVLGPATASNSGEASNTSDGTAHITTGGALATGNASATNLQQRQRNSVDGLGLVLGTQVGGVANVGLGVANSGVNGALGNASENDVNGIGGGGPATQDAGIGSDSADPFTGLIVGPATAANSGTASNTSDGEACVCTGAAVASGNVSSTTLIQDLDASVGSGVIVLTEAGGVLNAGLGLANTGINGAIGNSSDNEAQFNQDSVINDALLPLAIVGPQTAHNGGTAANTSAGKGHVATGKASGTGNQSTTDFVQAATVDSNFAVSTLLGGTANAGVGLANTGINFSLGNDSTNLAVLDQQADGAGLVSNDGEATNDSDGTAQIGDPTCCGDEVTPPTEQPPAQPPVTGLPRTGAELEAQAAIGLMLLLLGFGLRRRSKALA